MFHSLMLNGQPVPTEHAELVVPWWSFTKTVLAATALSLVRDGLIGLDDELPQGTLTLRQLLKHQAGLADYSELADYHAAVAEGVAPWSADNMLQRLDATRLRYTPGTSWRYSNVGYLQVVRVIERVTGQPVETALAQRVFTPMGVTQVRFAHTPEDLCEVYPASLASYHPGWVYHGLLVGPLSEAAAVLHQLLTGDFLPPALRHAMQDAIVLGAELPGRPWASPGYGLGLMIGGTKSGHRLTGHTGVGPGGVIAVYHCTEGGQAATCAVFSEGDAEGAVEAKALEYLLIALGKDRQA